MQGRLLPPIDNRIQCFPGIHWEREFALAADLGYQHIEWIYEIAYHEHNPLIDSNGINRIQQLIQSSGVSIVSICADYFMDIPYLTADESQRAELQNKLCWLIGQAGELGARYIDLPFVDASKINSRDDFEQVVEFVSPALEFAQKSGVKICLETDLDPKMIVDLLKLFSSDSLGVNYDSGNSASLGYNVEDEFSGYGERVSTIHVKDRALNGGTVPLGTGDVDFSAFFAQIKKCSFNGPIVIQASREGENEMDIAANNINFVTKGLN